MKKLSFVLILAVAAAPVSIDAKRRNITDKTKALIGVFVGSGVVLMLGAYGYNQRSRRIRNYRKPLLSLSDDGPNSRLFPNQETIRSQRDDLNKQLAKLIQQSFVINRTSKIAKLIKQGADPNRIIFINDDSSSPIGMPPLELALKNNLSLPNIKALVENGAEVLEYIVNKAQSTKKPQEIIDYLNDQEQPITFHPLVDQYVNEDENPPANYQDDIYDSGNLEIQ